MAEYKKAVVFYIDLIHTFEELTDTQAGRLIKHYLRYVNDLNPVAPDKMTKIIFEPIKQQLKRDLKKWEEIRTKRVEAGKLGGLKTAELKQNQANEANAQQSPANEAVTVTVKVKDTVIERESTAPDLKDSNLFRKPNIPTIQKLYELFSGAGGTKEMAESFFQKHEATGWYLNNTPIKSVAPLVTKFVRNWKKNDDDKSKKLNGSSVPVKSYAEQQTEKFFNEQNGNKE